MLHANLWKTPWGQPLRYYRAILMLHSWVLKKLAPQNFLIRYLNRKLTVKSFMDNTLVPIIQSIVHLSNTPIFKRSSGTESNWNTIFYIPIYSKVTSKYRTTTTTRWKSLINYVGFVLVYCGWQTYEYSSNKNVIQLGFVIVYLMTDHPVSLVLPKIYCLFTASFLTVS